MEKTLTISGIDVKFRSSAALPRLYRLKFHKDLFVDFAKLDKEYKKAKKQNKEDESTLTVDSLELFENIAYLMAKHADKEVSNDIEEWLEQFETFDIYDVLPEILELWNLENRQLSQPKKVIGQ